MSKNQRAKLLRIKEILERETDSEHGITMERLIDLLAMRGIIAERKSIYADLNTLRDELGMDISRASSVEREYKVLSREFDVSELRLIIDCIQADRSMSEQTADRLIHKLEGLCSKYEANQLQQSVIVVGRGKCPTGGADINVGYVHEAIYRGKQIMFRYFDYDIDGKKKYRTNTTGKNIYVVSPYYLVYDDGKYYLVGYYTSCEPHERVYRIDRMSNICLLEGDREGYDEMLKVDVTKYQKETFSMFHGERMGVSMVFDNSLVGAVRDQFGHDILMMKEDEDHFRVSVNVVVSDQFYGWIFGLGDRVRIDHPKKVQDGLLEAIKKVQKKYAPR